MLSKLHALALAFVWAVLGRFDLDEKFGRLATGETVTLDTYGLLTGHKRLTVSLDMFGLGDFAADTRAQVGFQTILAVTTVFVLAMVAVVVADNLDTSIGSPSNSALSVAEGDIISGFGDMASLIGVLFIVAIVVVIIFQLRRVQ